MRDLKITHYQIKTEKCAVKRASGLTLLCLSDLHNNVYAPGNQTVIRRAEETHPDLILAAGDMLSDRRNKADNAAVDFLSALTGTAPVFFVNGNHEMKVRRKEPERYGRFSDGLRRGGVRILENESAHLRFGERRIGIYGYELPMHYYRRFSRKKLHAARISESLGTPEAEEYTILITHNPVHFAAYAKWKADFVFAGHLHGGFVRLPFLGGVISPQFQFFPKYDRGLFSLGGSWMAVSAGMGGQGRLFRINNPAEMVVVKIC